MGGGSTKQKGPPQSGLTLRRDERVMLEACLYSLPFPQGAITAETVGAAARVVERVEYKDPISVTSKGDRAKGIYILVKGQAKVISSSEDTVTDLHPGSFFGEISTLFYVPVTATVQSTTPAQFLLLKQESLQSAVGQRVSMDLMDYYVRKRYFDTSDKLDQAVLMDRIATEALKRIPMFSKWEPGPLQSLVKQCASDGGIPYPVLLVPDRSLLVMEGDKAQEVVIVTRGKIEVRREKHRIATMDSANQLVWMGEEGVFTDTDNLCAVYAQGACQAIRLSKATIQDVTNRHKAAVGAHYERHSKVWQSRLGHHRQLHPGMKAELYLPVLINTLSQLEMFSLASSAFLYDVAMTCRAKAYAGNAVIVDGTGNPSKVRKALQASQSKTNQKGAPNQQPTARLIKGGEAASVVTEHDVFLLPLKGEMVVGGVENVVFTEKEIIYLPQAQLKEIKLIAKGETLILTIEGGQLLNLCNAQPNVKVKVPKPVL